MLSRKPRCAFTKKWINEWISLREVQWNRVVKNHKEYKRRRFFSFSTNYTFLHIYIYMLICCVHYKEDDVLLNVFSIWFTVRFLAESKFPLFSSCRKKRRRKKCRIFEAIVAWIKHWSVVRGVARIFAVIASRGFFPHSFNVFGWI